MIGGKNIHQRKIIEPEVEKKVEEPKVEKPKVEEPKDEKPKVDEPELKPVAEEDFYAMDKQEQIDLLKEFGLSYKEIKKLKFEKDRVDKIMELNGE